MTWARTHFNLVPTTLVVNLQLYVQVLGLLELGAPLMAPYFCFSVVSPH
jgi:hypothetical protein